MPVTDEQSRAFRDKLAQYGKVLLSTHKNPDGDGLGSVAAMAQALLGLNKDVSVVLPEEVPAKLRFLRFPVSYKIYSDELLLEDLTDVLFISLDSSKKERHGDVEKLIDKCSEGVSIDHHLVAEPFCALDIRNHQASSTGEILFYLLKKMAVPISLDMASALYTAICTDTERFLFDNTTSQTHQAAAELMGYGINAYQINKALFQAIPANALFLLGKLAQNLRVEFKGKLLWTSLSYQEYQAHWVEKDQLDFLLKTLVNVKGSEVTLFFKELEPDFISVNLRGKTDLNVAEIAGLFGGGGHRKAAGVKLRKPLREAIEAVLQKVREKIRAEAV